MTPKPEVPALVVTGGRGRYHLRCSACGMERDVFASKATAHQYAEAHRRRPHPKTITGIVADPLAVTDSIGVELTTPEEDPAA